MGSTSFEELTLCPAPATPPPTPDVPSSSLGLILALSSALILYSSIAYSRNLHLPDFGQPTNDFLLVSLAALLSIYLGILLISSYSPLSSYSRRRQYWTLFNVIGLGYVGLAVMALTKDTRAGEFGGGEFLAVVIAVGGLLVLLVGNGREFERW